MGKRKYKKPKVTFIFTPGYEDRFTLEILKIYDRRLREEAEREVKEAEEETE